MGRFGLFGPDSFAITRSSVEGCQRRFDADVLPQGAVEGATRGRALEAGEPPAGVSAASRLVCTRNESALLCHEPQELALGSLPPAADAAPDRVGHAAGVCSSEPL